MKQQQNLIKITKQGSTRSHQYHYACELVVVVCRHIFELKMVCRAHIHCHIPADRHLAHEFQLV
jgi:hypothetical protein